PEARLAADQHRLLALPFAVGDDLRVAPAVGAERALDQRVAVRRPGSVERLEVAMEQQEPPGRIEGELRQAARPREERPLGERRLRAFRDLEVAHLPVLDAGERERALAPPILLARQAAAAAAAARIVEEIPGDPDAAVAADRERRMEVVGDWIVAHVDHGTE